MADTRKALKAAELALKSASEVVLATEAELEATAVPAVAEAPAEIKLGPTVVGG